MSGITQLSSRTETVRGCTRYHYPEGQCGVCKKSNTRYYGEQVVKLDSCKQSHPIHDRCLKVWQEMKLSCPGCDADSKLHKKVTKMVEKAHYKEQMTFCKWISVGAVAIVVFASACFLGK